jgi:UDP-N-acetylmuramate--alanine ligase
LDAARLCGFRRIHVLFQPHRYTRTFHLMEEFAGAFNQADSLFVLDIYAASEKPIPGVNAEALVERIRQFGHRGAEYVGLIDRGVEALAEVAREGDAVLTLGAGNVWQAGDRLLEKLRSKG